MLRPDPERCAEAEFGRVRCDIGSKWVSFFFFFGRRAPAAALQQPDLLQCRVRLQGGFTAMSEGGILPGPSSLRGWLFVWLVAGLCRAVAVYRLYTGLQGQIPFGL